MARVQLRLERPLVAAAGDRLVLRLTAPQATIAGGVVVDPAPPRSLRPQPARPVEAERVATAPVAVRASTAEADALHARLAADPLAPLALAAADEDALRVLVEGGRAVRAGRDLAFTADAFAAATREAVALAASGEPLTIATLRDRLGCSRRHAQAILETLDGQGVTRRVGDVRTLRRRGRDLAAGRAST
jgi:selenocysteine-specific elongation factor